MLSRSLTVACILVLLLLQDCIAKRLWEYEPISLVASTSDAKKLNLEVRIERRKRGAFSVGGSLLVNYDSDNTSMIEAEAYRSNTGAEDDYVAFPWTIPKQTFEEYIKGFYKAILYNNLKDCSNLPLPEDAYPWPRGTYKFENCNVSGDGLPDYMPDAYYKFIFKVTGEVEWGVVLIVKIFKKLDVMG